MASGHIIGILLLQLLLLNWALGADTECPFKLDYVRQLPWDKSTCESANNEANCCQTLRSLLGVGFAQYLKDASVFEFPNNASALSCLRLFQEQLDSLSLSSDLVANCFNDTSLFVSSPLLCAGIQTKQDWIRKLGTTQLDSTCKGDLSDVGACLECTQSGNLVTNMLANMDKNLTTATSLKCFYFTCLYAAGVVNEFGPENRDTAQCILRLPFVQNTSNRRVLAYTFIGIAIALVLVCALGLLYCLLVTRIDPKAVLHRRFVRRNKTLLKATVKPNTGAVWFDIRIIRGATDNFSEANLIGQGGFGTVYRGTLPDARRIAVKRIRNCTPEGDYEFLNEVEIINNTRQRNLVVLRGCCVASDEREGHQRFLIYDYMSNGSLDDHIFGQKSKAQPLSWPQRRNIVLGTAKGLVYLHDSIEPAIYHRDIKATNILLDDEMNACVADFGLARIMNKVGDSHLTTRVAGTHGYLAPEYALYGQLTDKSDVYSFGVLLLEIMSGRKALDTSAESASHYLIADWAWTMVREGRISEIVDERIRQSGEEKVQMERFVLVGILCSHIMVAFRPRMVEAVKMLEGEAEIPEIPDRPSPLLLHDLSVIDKGGSFLVSDSVSRPAFSPTAQRLC